MRRQTRLTVSLGLPGALLASALAAAQAPPAPPPPAPVAMPVAPPTLNPQEQLAQLTERFRPTLRVEYHFLRVVCDLTPEERTPIARDVEREFKDAMVRYQEMQRSPQFRRPGESGKALPDPRTLIVEGLTRAAEAHLTPERADRYRREIKQRAEERKRVIIQSIVLKLDQALVLSSEQRAQLAARLGSGWDEAWFPTEHMMMNAGHYLSAAQRQLIIPLLSEEQKKGLELSFLNQNATGTVQVLPATVADFPEDDELTRAREAEVNSEELSP